MSENLENEQRDPEFILIGSDTNCPPCDEIKELLKDKITDGSVKYVDINSEEAEPYLGGLEELPLPYAVRSKDGRECQIFADEDVVLVKCTDEEQVTPLVEPPAASD